MVETHEVLIERLHDALNQHEEIARRPHSPGTVPVGTSGSLSHLRGCVDQVVYALAYMLRNEVEKGLGDAIGTALYNSLSHGKGNVPCLSELQKFAAARAALDYLAEHGMRSKS